MGYSETKSPKKWAFFITLLHIQISQLNAKSSSHRGEYFLLVLSSMDEGPKDYKNFYKSKLLLTSQYQTSPTICTHCMHMHQLPKNNMKDKCGETPFFGFTHFHPRDPWVLSVLLPMQGISHAKTHGF
jgi:hypothetical protein